MSEIVKYSHNQSMQALVPKSVDEAVRLAETLASASLVPTHLQGRPGDCLLVVMQAQRWGMDVLSVAQCTSFVHGRLCYEGKLVAAALYSMGAIDGRLSYTFSGQGENRTVTVTGKPRGSSAEQSVSGSVKGWKTKNTHWESSPDDMLVYRATRQWARRYAPEALLGVYTPDEVEVAEATISTAAASPAQPAALSQYPDDRFTANLPKWREGIQSGKMTAEKVINTVSTIYALTEGQEQAIRDCEAIEAEYTEAEGAAQ